MAEPAGWTRKLTAAAQAAVTAREVVLAHYAHEAKRRERERRVEESTALLSIGGDPRDLERD